MMPPKTKAMSQNNSLNLPRLRAWRAVIASCITLFMIALAGCTKKEAAEKKEPEKKHEANIVTLTKENLEHAEIQTEPARIGNLETTLRAAGRVSENANKTAKVSSTLEGRLMKLNYDVNDAVKAGDVMGLIQTPELLGRPLELKAPLDGIVVERKSTVGELVGKDTQIYTISDPTDLWVVAEIKERDIGAVKEGQEVGFSVLAYPGEKFSGKIVRIGSRVEEKSRTLEVRIETTNPEGRLKAGMFADVEIVTTVVPNVLIIPDTAMQSEENNAIAFIALDATRFEKRVIKTGMEQKGQVQVLEGIKEGEKVVTQGSFILKSEMLKGELGEE
jgi:multidrug efflux pump subunit AcrA (membrane-fusion protein)